MEPDYISVRGAQQHNLKHIDVTIPRHRLVVITGVSGSGKSSLAFDTIYAEGQRRYVESLSSYARQFLGQMEKPRVDFIGGLSPAISIEQKTVSKNPRSTVGTVTEVLDYLRVLYARVGVAHCPQCGRRVEAQSAQQIAAQLAALPEGTRLQLLAPVVQRRKGTHAEIIEQARRDGYIRARIDGVPVELDSSIALAKTKAHTIELIVDRLVIRKGGDESDEDTRAFQTRLIDSVETTLRASNGLLIADLGDGNELRLSEQHACTYCGISFPDLTPQLFSFNSPLGMCPDCNGLGTQMTVDTSLIVTNPERSLLDGALRWYGELRKRKDSMGMREAQSLATHYGVDLETPWQELPQRFRDVVLYGSGEEKIRFTYQGEWSEGTYAGESIRVVRGIVHNINRLYHQTSSEQTRRYYASFMSEQPCPGCHGTRLRSEARGVTVGGKTITEVGAMAIGEAYAWALALSEGDDDAAGAVALSGEEMEIAGEILKEIRERLRFMLNVGLHYLTLDRPAPSLSGGEGQRIRLASQLGCGLVGVFYILDEPSIGLHARDNRALIDTLLRLRDMGNTVLVVEHDAEMMHSADWLIDLGPGAGILGGEVTAAGTPAEVSANPRSLTGRYLSGALTVSAPNGEQRRVPSDRWLSVVGARMHNLKNVTARFPLGLMTVVTGVSGSGKSSLISQTLYPALARAYHNAQEVPGPHERIEGLDLCDNIINVTQDPIGRTPRSNPATYVKLFDEIRHVFASTPEARARGYKPDRFSFNVKGGRCEACQGHGQRRIEMHFLSDVWITCRECNGTRFNRETLAVTYKGKTIADVLEMDVREALDFFANVPRMERMLRTLHDVGLDYIKLGQSATTLSGGEAQRIKLAKELSHVSTGRTIYILDEPTTGLHFADIQRLLDVLNRLVEAGNTVIVIEHNLDVIRAADWILDLGPEGGRAGGYLLAEGSPEDVAQIEASATGQCLRNQLRSVSDELLVSAVAGG